MQFEIVDVIITRFRICHCAYRIACAMTFRYVIIFAACRLSRISDYFFSIRLA